MWPHVRAVAWEGITWRTWASIVYSSIFALGVAYTIWYAGVRQIGSARTSVYSNVIPIVAMATAVIFLGEPLRFTNLLGATAVVGVALTRTAPQAVPAEPHAGDSRGRGRSRHPSPSADPESRAPNLLDQPPCPTTADMRWR
jgi:hypothetical protein